MNWSRIDSGPIPILTNSIRFQFRPILESNRDCCMPRSNIEIASTPTGTHFLCKIKTSVNSRGSAWGSGLSTVPYLEFFTWDTRNYFFKRKMLFNYEFCYLIKRSTESVVTKKRPMDVRIRHTIWAMNSKINFIHLYKINPNY